MPLELTGPRARSLWNAIRNRLDGSLPDWKQRIERLGQVAAVERREARVRWRDDEVLEALLKAVLSNNTDWAKVESVLPELRCRFSDFCLRRYAEITEDEVQSHVGWFQDRRAGSNTLGKSLLGLAKTAQILQQWSAANGSAEHYFLNVIDSLGGDPKRAAVALGKPGSPKKLPALGVPIAAESLRNMGFDICKPDRHVCRAAGSFGLAQFRNWPDRLRTKAPQASANEMLNTMTIVESIARSVGARPTLLDGTIWLLCSKSGLHLRNEELGSLASTTSEEC